MNAERKIMLCRSCGHEATECDCTVPELVDRDSYLTGYQDGRKTERERQPQDKRARTSPYTHLTDCGDQLTDIGQDPS
jgi:hypothetical protein